MFGIFDWFKRRKQKKELNQLFNSAMADIRIYEQRQDYRGAVIAAFGGLSNVAWYLLKMKREPFQTGREFGNEVALKANISTEVINDFLFSFEVARYTDRDIDYDNYTEAIQRLDICFRGIREKGVQVSEPGKQGKSKKIKQAKQRKNIKQN